MKENIKKGVVIKGKVVYNGDLYTRTGNSVITAPKSVIDHLVAGGKVEEMKKNTTDNAGNPSQSPGEKSESKKKRILSFNNKKTDSEDDPTQDNGDNHDDLNISFNPDEVIK